MNVTLEARKIVSSQRVSIVDCDLHPKYRKPRDMLPYLEKRWQDHAMSYGLFHHQALVEQGMYPRMMASGQRVDAAPADGGPPGSDLKLMQSQHLDVQCVEHGMLVCIDRCGFGERNLDFAAAMAHACNEWQLDDWVEQDRRLKAGICIIMDDPTSAVKEIELRASDPRFAQIMVHPRPREPLGRRRYWHIYEAAERASLPIGMHPSFGGSGLASTGSGWPTYYIEDHYGFGSCLQSVVMSLILEGVFEQFPKLKFVLIEGSFSWAPALGWRMDRHFERFRSEVPHLKRKPSEYLREHFWFTTQPIEEPENPTHLEEIIDWIGWDKLLFSSDYPHWDYDDPNYLFKFPISEEKRLGVLRNNAKAFYNL